MSCARFIVANLQINNWDYTAIKKLITDNSRNTIMSEPITLVVSDRICKHMNEDHADALVLYAKVFGNSPAAETAQMQSIDPEGMNLSVKIDGAVVPVRIEFERTLKDAEDAHHTLVEMIKQARKSSTDGF